jgi:hypothetical protein
MEEIAVRSNECLTYRGKNIKQIERLIFDERLDCNTSVVVLNVGTVDVLQASHPSQSADCIALKILKFQDVLSKRLPNAQFIFGGIPLPNAHVKFDLANRVNKTMEISLNKNKVRHFTYIKWAETLTSFDFQSSPAESHKHLWRIDRYHVQPVAAKILMGLLAVDDVLKRIPLEERVQLLKEGRRVLDPRYGGLCDDIYLFEFGNIFIIKIDTILDDLRKPSVCI